MKTLKVLRNLSKRFPKALKESYDHVGLQTGKLPKELNTVLLCLDFDETVYNKMISDNLRPDMILTHHPFIFGTKYRVFKKDYVKKDLCDKIDALGIPVYSMHTNFDIGEGGMNDALAEALCLQDIKPLDTCKMARGGKLPSKMEIHEFAKYATEKLNLDYTHLISAGKKEIETVAVLGGGGAYKYVNAMKEGYDIYLTGDVPHHIRRDVISYHYNLLEVNHEVEKIFCYQMKKLIEEIDPSINCIIVDHEELPELITR